MIELEIRYNDNYANINFPIGENALYATLSEIHAIDGKDAPNKVFVSEVVYPEEFGFLAERFVNLDEMNYLARRMDSFDETEMDQFLIGVSKLDVKSEKSLINLTFNLDKFTLVQDVSSYGKIGRAYVQNTEGSVPVNDEDDPKYAIIGKGLLDRGITEMTGKGLLVYDPFNVMQEVYDGKTFPPYYDRSDYMIAAEMEYNGKTELLLLPEEELAINKAVKRLGAESVDDCILGIDDNTIDNEKWVEKIQDLINSDGLLPVNSMMRQMNDSCVDLEKLYALADIAEAETSEQIAGLIKHMDDVNFIPGANNESDVGHYIIDNDDNYHIDVELEEYFDFSAFGEDISADYNGVFCNSGFVYFNCGMSLDDITDDMETNENDDFIMRGM